MREAVVARSGQEGSVVLNEDSVASASEAAACALPADVSSVQVTGYVGSQRSTRGAGAHREEDDEVVVVASGLGGQGSAAVEVAVVVAATAPARVDGMAKVEKMVEKMKADHSA